MTSYKEEEEGDERRHHYAVTCQFLQKLRAHLPQRSGRRFQLRLASPGIDFPMTIDNLKAREPKRLPLRFVADKRRRPALATARLALTHGPGRTGASVFGRAFHFVGAAAPSRPSGYRRFCSRLTQSTATVGANSASGGDRDAAGAAATESGHRTPAIKPVSHEEHCYADHDTAHRDQCCRLHADSLSAIKCSR